jgi:hypothetical protein
MLISKTAVESLPNEKLLIGLSSLLVSKLAAFKRLDIRIGSQQRHCHRSIVSFLRLSISLFLKLSISISFVPQSHDPLLRPQN